MIIVTEKNPDQQVNVFPYQSRAQAEKHFCQLIREYTDDSDIPDEELSVIQTKAIHDGYWIVCEGIYDQEWIIVLNLLNGENPSDYLVHSWIFSYFV